MLNQILLHQNFIDNILLIIGIVIYVELIYPGVISIIEKEYRAAKVSSIFAVELFIPANPKNTISNCKLIF